MADESLFEQLKDYDFVKITWPDMHGIPRGLSTSGRNLRDLLEAGTYAWRGVNAMGPNSGFVMIDEILAEGNGNMNIKARPGTAHPLTWSGGDKYKVGEVLGNCFHPDGTQIETCTTNAALKQVARLEERGCNILSAFEMEFTLYNADSKTLVSSGTDLFSTLALSEIEDYVFDLDKHLEAAGVELESLHSEWGASQVEITLKPQLGIKTADSTFIFKQAAKEIGRQKGYQAVFMAKPEVKTLSNGAHFTHSIWDTSGRNLFTGDNGTIYSMSEFGYHWMAGLCKHAGALTALCCPTVNCYRRLNKPRVPSRANWGFDNRLATFRAKGYGAKGACIESRLPSSACNPYLVLAGTIAAGLDGVDKKLKCPPHCLPDGSGNATSLPETLQDALKALQTDDVMVDAIGKDLVKWIVKAKTETEVSALPEFNPEKIDPELIRKEFDLYARII